jgi:hypothetical protein
VAGHPRASRRGSACADPPYVVGEGFHRGRDAADAAAGIRSVAGTTYPNIEALSVVAMQTTVEEDFDRGLRMLLDGVATRRPRKRR